MTALFVACLVTAFTCFITSCVFEWYGAEGDALAYAAAYWVLWAVALVVLMA